MILPGRLQRREDRRAEIVAGVVGLDRIIRHFQCTDSKRCYRETVELGQDDLGGFGPDEGFGTGIVLGEISIDGGLQVDDRAEHTTADALPRHLGEDVLDRVRARRPRSE